MGDVTQPSSALAPAPGVAAGSAEARGEPRTGAELGLLRNGVGSLKNLELLLKSIKVGQKGLFAAIAAVHADCAPMIASSAALGDALAATGVEASCSRCLENVLTASLRKLESALSRTVASKRLSVGARLELEGVIAASVRELGAALHLALLLNRTRQPRPPELTPVALLYGGSDSPERDGVPVHMQLPQGGCEMGINVHLDVAQLLLAIGVGLCAHGQRTQPVLVSFEHRPGHAPLTRITRGRGPGPVLRLAAPSVVEPTLPCAQEGLRSLGGSFEYSAPEHRVCICWPLS